MPPSTSRTAPKGGLAALVCAAVLFGVAELTGLDLFGAAEGTTFAAGPSGSSRAAARAEDPDADAIRRHFSGMRSDVQVEATGEVVHLLRTDTRGDRHQLFLVELSNGLTLKLSHNIDVAPVIPLEVGDVVRFAGEYEWNEKGGVVHWTHRNTRGTAHAGGWILHEGTRYE